ncbi:MAG: AMP-binding protein [Microthrixaceae bacterium]
MYDGEWVLSSFLDDRAEKLGDKVALTSHAGELSYGGLRSRAQQLAGGLVELGVAPGDRVATMLDPTIDYVAAWFATAWAGCVEVPVNTDYKGTFLEHILRESGASVLIVEERWVERLRMLDIPEVRHIVVVGSEEAREAPGGIVQHSLESVESASPIAPVPRTERDLTYILYTSGTTGPSKGVMHSGGSALWTAKVWVDMMQLTEDDVAYSVLPLFHVTARSAATTSNMWAGGSTVLRSRFTVSGFWDDVRSVGATNFMYMGAVITLLGGQDPKPDDLDNPLRIGGGAAAPPHLQQMFRERFGVELIEVFGMTEIGTATGPLPGRPSPTGTMGKPFDHLQIEIHDENDHPVPAETPGEIVVRPAQANAIFQGYWGNPEATVDAWRNLWFHTGDRGTMSSDGGVTFVDRIKDSLRRRGENISSFEVERSVGGHPGVLECAAYAVKSELTDDEVMVAIVCREGTPVDADEFFRFCVECMPRFAVPRYVRFMDALPKTPTARVQKHVLRTEGITEDSVDREALGIQVPHS